MVSIPKDAAIRSEHSSPAHRLLLAARSGQVEEVSAVLLAARPSLVARDALTQSGRTLLHVAAHHGHLGVVLAAVTQGAGLDVNVANKTGHTPLHEASAQGQTRMALLLLSLGGDVTQADKEGVTCLMLAAQGGHTATAKVLIGAGADVRSANSQGWTALHYAAFKGHLPLVLLLLHQGADIEAMTADGKWAGLIAEEEGEESCFEELCRARGEATMATDSRVVALEGQLLRLRECECRQVESRESLLVRQPLPQQEEMEELVKCLQSQLAERERQVELLQGNKKSVLPCMDPMKTNSAPSSPRPPRKWRAWHAMDPSSRQPSAQGPQDAPSQLPPQSSDLDDPLTEADMFGGRSITELVEMSMQNPNCMSAIRKELKADMLTPKIQRKFVQKTPQKSLSPLANEDTSRQSVSPLAVGPSPCTAPTP